MYGGDNMANRDGTGPNGMGPLTGRGMGPCGSGFRRGFGRGFNRGYDRRYMEPMTLTKEEQIKILEAEKQEIEKQLKELKE
jgi:hypothetical protein